MIAALIFLWSWMLDNPLISLVLVAAFVAALVGYVRYATVAHRRDVAPVAHP